MQHSDNYRKMDKMLPTDKNQQIEAHIIGQQMIKIANIIKQITSGTFYIVFLPKCFARLFTCYY